MLDHRGHVYRGPVVELRGKNLFPSDHWVTAWNWVAGRELSGGDVDLFDDGGWNAGL